MIINYWILSVALVLLWVPRQWLRFGGKVIKVPSAPRRNTGDGHARSASLKVREEFPKPRNWVDLLRAATGAVAISVGGFAFDVQPDATWQTGLHIFIIESAILVIAVLIQTIRFENRLALTAPVFFLLGLSFGVIGWQAALFACVSIWIINLVLPSSGVFLFVFAGLEMCFGMLLARLSVREAIIAGLLSILPVLFSAILKRRLVRMGKRSRSVRVSS